MILLRSATSACRALRARSSHSVPRRLQLVGSFAGASRSSSSRLPYNQPAAASLSQHYFQQESWKHTQRRYQYSKLAAAAGVAAFGFYNLGRANAEEESEKTVEDLNKNDKREDVSVEKYDYILVGGGTACYHAVMAIRENDKDGRILVVGSDEGFPFEKSALTKGLWLRDLTAEEEGEQAEVSKKAESAGDPLEGYYSQSGAGSDSRDMEETYNCTFMRGTNVVRAFQEDRVLALRGNGTKKLVRYGKLLIATGGTPRVPMEVTDAALPNVSTYQSYRDYEVRLLLLKRLIFSCFSSMEENASDLNFTESR